MLGACFIRSARRRGLRRRSLGFVRIRETKKRTTQTHRRSHRSGLGSKSRLADFGYRHSFYGISKGFCCYRNRASYSDYAFADRNYFARNFVCFSQTRNTESTKQNAETLESDVFDFEHHYAGSFGNYSGRNRFRHDSR